MTKAEEILNEYGCPEIPFDENVTMFYPSILSAMQGYGKYCADQAWNDALKEVGALMQKPCWDLTLVEDIKKLKK